MNPGDFFLSFREIEPHFFANSSIDDECTYAGRHILSFYKLQANRRIFANGIFIFESEMFS
jgi:hypothetical protein